MGVRVLLCMLCVFWSERFYLANEGVIWHESHLRDRCESAYVHTYMK
jgi:hypothetical protein